MSESYNKQTLGAFFRNKREENGLLVRQVAAVTEMDQAIISRIENGERLPTKEQLTKLAGLYGLDMNVIYADWLTEKMLRDYGNEPYASDAFKEANVRMLYNMRKKEDE